MTVVIKTAVHLQDLFPRFVGTKIYLLNANALKANHDDLPLTRDDCFNSC